MNFIPGGIGHKVTTIVQRFRTLHPILW